MGNRDNPENSLCMASVTPVIEGGPTLPQCWVDYLIPMQDYHMRFANPAILIGVPEDFKAQATVIRQKKEIIQRQQFIHIKFELPRIKRNIGEFHSKGF